MRIEGRLCVVTGAGSGLGRATARTLHESGARLLLLDVNEEKLLDVQSRFGADTTTIGVADVTNPDQVETALGMAIARFGPLRVAISCAGISSSAKIVSKGAAHDYELWRRVLDINLSGTFNVMRLAAAHMVGNGPDAETGERGVIINTASIAAEDGQTGQAAYAASKAGIVGMSLPVARDLAEHSVRCVAIAPGLFKTELFEQISEKGTEALKRALLYPRRMGHPEEFASLAKVVIENPYLNGSLLRLDGGARLPA